MADIERVDALTVVVSAKASWDHDVRCQCLFETLEDLLRKEQRHNVILRNFPAADDGRYRFLLWSALECMKDYRLLKGSCGDHIITPSVVDYARRLRLDFPPLEYQYLHALGSSVILAREQPS